MGGEHWTSPPTSSGTRPWRARFTRTSLTCVPNFSTSATTRWRCFPRTFCCGGHGSACSIRTGSPPAPRATRVDLLGPDRDGDPGDNRQAGQVRRLARTWKAPPCHTTQRSCLLLKNGRFEPFPKHVGQAFQPDQLCQARKPDLLFETVAYLIALLSLLG